MPQANEMMEQDEQKRSSIPILYVRILAYTFLIIITLFAYRGVQNFDFVYDDELYITQNEHVIGGLTFEGLKWAFTTFYAANWHPTTWISHMIDAELYGQNPMGHHWTNLQIHMANVLILFYLLNQVTGSLCRSAFVAALFAVHPLHVESVAWVAERKDVLSTFFGFLSALSYCRYVKEKRRWDYFLAFVFLSLGLMSKPMLVTFPFVFLLLDYWPLNRIQFSINTDPNFNAGDRYFKHLFRIIAEKMPFFILSIISSVITVIAQSNGGAVKSFHYLPMDVRVANAVSSYTAYIIKAIYPFRLSVFYPHPMSDLSLMSVALSAIFLVSVTYAAISLANKRPYFVMGWFWYIGTLFPVIGLVQVGDQAMADRYTYVPLIGIFIMFTWGVSDIAQRWSSRFSKIFLKISGGLIVVSLAIATISQSSHWKDASSLFTHAIAVTHNNSLAHTNLGAAFHKSGRIDEAVVHYRKTLEINPFSAKAQYRLGSALAEGKKYDEAIYYLKQAVYYDPNYVDALNNLACTLLETNRLIEAHEVIRQALKIRPEASNLHYNLGIILLAQNHSHDAAASFQTAIALSSKNIDAHFSLGNYLFSSGNLSEAGAHYLEVLKLNPEHVKAYNNLAVLLREKGKIDASKMYFRKAIEIDPNFSVAIKNLKALEGGLSLEISESKKSESGLHAEQK